MPQTVINQVWIFLWIKIRRFTHLFSSFFILSIFKPSSDIDCLHVGNTFWDYSLLKCPKYTFRVTTWKKDKKKLSFKSRLRNRILIRFLLRLTELRDKTCNNNQEPVMCKGMELYLLATAGTWKLGWDFYQFDLHLWYYGKQMAVFLFCAHEIMYKENMNITHLYQEHPTVWYLQSVVITSCIYVVYI